jgi:hypothetical protein
MIIVMHPCETTFPDSKSKEQSDFLSLLLDALPTAVVDAMPKISEATLTNSFNRQFTKKINLGDFPTGESILILSAEPNRKFLSFFNRSNTGIYISAAMLAETEFAEGDPDFLYYIPAGEIVTVSTAVPTTPLSMIFESNQEPSGYLIIGIGYLDKPTTDNPDTLYP